MSPNLLEHAGDLCGAHPPAIEQARDNAHMVHDRLMFLLLGLRRGGLRHLRLGMSSLGNQVAAAILERLLDSAFLAAVVLNTAARGTASAVCLPTAERTAQVNATGVGRMSEEEDAAMSAAPQTPAKLRLVPKDPADNGVVLKNQAAHFPVAIPDRMELEMPLDLYGKKTSAWLISLMAATMPSSRDSTDVHVEGGDS